MNGSILLDTDVVSYGFKRDSRFRWYRRRLKGKVLCISFMTFAELIRWALERGWEETRLTQLEQHVTGFQILAASNDLCRTWAEVMHAATRKGRRIEVPDAWIAATALRHGLPLATHNATHFEAVDGLQVITAPKPSP